MMGESAPTGASLGGSFSQGVDLHELERLRVLVRFEFDRELTQDELVTALQRCHNNTREAYHFLKEQRRQAQLLAAAAMVAAATNSTATTMASHSNGMMSPAQTTAAASTGSAPSSNGKRRSDSDGDATMDTPSKRQRSLELRTVDLSEEDDDMVDLTQATQLPFASQPANQDQAIAVISDVVTRYLRADEDVEDSQWLTGVAGALNLQRDAEVDQSLVAVVASLANALSHVASTDIPAVQSDGVKQIVEVLVELPRQNQNDVELRLRPSDAELDAQVGTIENSFTLTLSEQLKTAQRAQAARNAITEITKACGSCIARQESIIECTRHAQVFRRRVRSRIGELTTIIRGRLDKASADVATSEREMGEARNVRAQYSRTMMAAINEQKAALMRQGEDEVDATVDAHRKIFESTVPEIVQLRRQRDDSHALFTARKDDVMRANTRLEFYQKLEALRQKAAPHTLRWLEVSAARVIELKNDAERSVEDKLKLYMAKLGQALRLYYEYHTMRQQLATKARKKEQDSLLEHEEFYDDLVPSAKRDIENKIREYNAVILHSTQQMREVASLQCDLWDGKRKLFTAAFFSVVGNEYRRLWEDLSGGAREMMSDCVQTIRDQPASAPPPTAAAVPVNHSVMPTTEIKVEPYQFVGRGGDGVMPVMRDVPVAATSPFVDLTSDVEEDDAMNGSHPLDRVEFDNSSRFTRVDDDDAAMPGNAPVVELVDGHKSAATVKPPETAGSRQFPVGTTLYWHVRDGDDESVYVGQVKERKEDAHVMVTSEGYEFDVPTEYLFTQEEVEEQWPAAVQQHEGNAADGGCSIM